MFGRKKVQAAPLRFANGPRPSHVGPAGAESARVDAAIAVLSEAVGLDLDFGQAFIFAPSLWRIPRVGKLLTIEGLQAEMMGNRLALLKSPVTVARVHALPADAPLRQTLEEADFGMVLYNPDAENGYADGLAAMQAEALQGFLEQSDNPQELHYAVWDLFRWSSEVMKGKVAL